MSKIVTVNPEIMHGLPCFAGTRVGVKTLFDYLKAGHGINEFLDHFPTVGRDQVMGLLEQVQQRAEQEAKSVGT